MRRIAGTRFGALLVGATLALAGCGRPGSPPGTVLRWVAGRTAPAFDPGGPPSPLREALERALSFPLFERDSAGRVVPLAADSCGTSADGRTFTVRLRAGLAFTDGTPATSADVRASLLAALARDDHATAAWDLAPVAGIEKLRPGRPLPALGIDCPDPRTLRFRLARPDTQMAARLADGGLGAPWRLHGPGWAGAVGLGPCRVAAEDAGHRLVLVRAGTGAVRHAAADTIEVRFVTGAPRVRYVLRRNLADVAWPLPPGLLSQPLPAGWGLVERAASPPRRLLIVFRADVPPTTNVAARKALAHALNRSDLLDALGAGEGTGGPWLAGAGPFDFPRLDLAEARDWLARGRLGASFHVVLAYDADGEGAEIARALQVEWAAAGVDAELRALRGADALAEPLRAAAGQVQLVTAQAPGPGAAGELAALVLPLRGPAIGGFRTGWRTREFDHAIAGGPGGTLPDPAAAQARIAEERIALPLAEIPWRWAVREGAAGVAFRTASGPDFAPPGPAPATARKRAGGSR